MVTGPEAQGPTPREFRKRIYRFTGITGEISRRGIPVTLIEGGQFKRIRRKRNHPLSFSCLPLRGMECDQPFTVHCSENQSQAVGIYLQLLCECFPGHLCPGKELFKDLPP